MGKEKKQFPLDSKENCCIYLCRIISSCELCMDRLKKYNAQTKSELEKYSQVDVVPYDIYSELCDKTYNILSYLLNLLGDSQNSSISYFKYRQQIQKRINHGNLDIPLSEIEDDISDMMSEFNKMRNWQNHIPESLLIAEVAQMRAGKSDFPMNPVEIMQYKYVTYEYFEHLYLSNAEFHKNARQIIQAAKQDYSLLMGQSITYPRVFSDKPLGIEKSYPAESSAKVQGLSAKKDAPNV